MPRVSYSNSTAVQRSLYLTLPAVTQQIKGAKSLSGLPLFDRSEREVRLTPAG